MQINSQSDWDKWPTAQVLFITRSLKPGVMFLHVREFSEPRPRFHFVYCKPDALPPFERVKRVWLAQVLPYMRIPVERQLRSHGEYDVMHSGQEYTVLSEGDAATEYLRDEWLRIRADGPLEVPTYRFKLTGAHGGPPIEVLMVYPRDEDDGEGGRDFVWDMLVWADDHSPFDHDYFLDAYTDPLRDELREDSERLGLMPEPNRVVQTSREVIEHKLLAALDNPETVAILASKEDLDILIFALSQVAGYSLAIPREPARELRAQEFGAGLEQLRREAFGE